ncbi:BgTH12-04627 [Blumeria graminis f. sp. triticale]|uniref:BgTH12-04627 n=1 Tax=Blumeria graminis f. sp. triticale TaxID=1689686 RepID=A0A9W4CUV2_BLUGR|nr:BgTH12-04627 [Blumeria graminis f. sp. triticale]
MLKIEVESWIWYSIAIILVLARYVSRWLQWGTLKALRLEDYAMFIVFFFYTTLTVNLNIIAALESNLVPPSQIHLLSPASIPNRIRGSKTAVAIEQSMIMTTWGCKLSLLLLYNKLTFGLSNRYIVKVVTLYVIISFTTMEILYFGVWCRPFNQYWAVPVENDQCATKFNHMIINAIFNMSSDLMILCIPLPLLLACQLPKGKKLMLTSVFGLGIFVILAAALNKYFSFCDPFSHVWEIWYMREASMAVYVANMPMLWSLSRQLFGLQSFFGRALSPKEAFFDKATVNPCKSLYENANPFMGFEASHIDDLGMEDGDTSRTSNSICTGRIQESCITCSENNESNFLTLSPPTESKLACHPTITS